MTEIIAVFDGMWRTYTIVAFLLWLITVSFKTYNRLPVLV